MNKKILIALAVSVMLNCSFIGYQIARSTGPEHHGVPAKREHVNRMPERDAFKNVSGKVSQRYSKEMQRARSEVDKAILAEPFNVEALKKAMVQASAERRRMDLAAHQNMIKIIEEMTPQERKDFVQKKKKKKKEIRRKAERRKGKTPRSFEKGKKRLKKGAIEGKKFERTGPQSR